ncbi:sulfatase-like hydrolase/transferase [bacterium]|nr:sulfatase-like hydrolase/transferase [bacterium]
MIEAIMDRRLFMQSATMAVASLALSSPVSARQKPNIIFIMADDLGYGDLGCYGGNKVNTPNIDRMAREGLKFTQHYAGSTVCAPSRCCIMTGLHTGHAYIRGNKEIQPEGQWPLPAETDTIAKRMKKAGYKTGIVGKWGLGSPGSEGEPNKQGFDHWFGYLCQREAHSFYPDHLWRNGERVELDGKTYSHDLMTKEVLDFIEDSKEDPFFLYVPYTIPHAALQVPAESMDPYMGKFGDDPERPTGHYAKQKHPRAAFAGMVSRMDRDVGRILQQLKTLGLAENTLVMFSSDNGPHREGGHDPKYFDSNGPLRGIKRDLYDGGIRVPMIAYWPGTIQAGTETDHISAFWDLMPTYLELGGAEPPRNIDGISMAPLLTGKPNRQKKHEYLYWEFHRGGFNQAIRMGKWKAVRLGLESPIELYNIENDIGETDNVAEKHPAIVKKAETLFKKAHTESKLFPMKR